MGAESESKAKTSTPKSYASLTLPAAAATAEATRAKVLRSVDATLAKCWGQLDDDLANKEKVDTLLRLARVAPAEEESDAPDARAGNRIGRDARVQVNVCVMRCSVEHLGR